MAVLFLAPTYSPFPVANVVAERYAYLPSINNLGVAYKTIGKTEEAIALYKKAIALNPDYAAAYKNLAVIYYLEKQYALAIKYCDRAMALGYKAAPNFLKLLQPYRQEKIR